MQYILGTRKCTCWSVLTMNWANQFQAIYMDSTQGYQLIAHSYFHHRMAKGLCTWIMHPPNSSAWLDIMWFSLKVANCVDIEFRHWIVAEDRVTQGLSWLSWQLDRGNATLKWFISLCLTFMSGTDRLHMDDHGWLAFQMDWTTRNTEWTCPDPDPWSERSKF